MMKTRLLLSMALVAGLAGSAVADVRLPKIFTDNMMLQRNQPIRVWGWAAPGEAVRVALTGADASTTADAQGKWRVELPARKQGDNLELTVTGKNVLVLTNVIVGDIWLCSGQSNMEMGLGGCLGAADDCKAADLPAIRRIKFNHAQSAQPEADAPAAGAWQVCTPQTAGGFSAVAFYFAREIQARTGVPIGILDDNWGGTQIEPWTAPGGVLAEPELHEAVLVMNYLTHGAWPSAAPALPGKLPSEAVKPSGLDVGLFFPGNPGASGGWCSIYNAMIAPLTRFPIKGVLWYQGEANGDEGESYFLKMRALVGGWRQAWNLGDFPFYFVQLASFQNATDNPAGGDGWARLREAQTGSLSITNCGMAVIIDTVPLPEAGNVHPGNKVDVGLRLARWALQRDYGQKDLVPSGPIYKSMKIEGDKVRLSFDYTGSGLMAGLKEGRAPAVENPGGKLKRFAIAGADKKWVWAEAVINGQTVVVSAPGVVAPVAVRYAFSMNPAGANLYNRDGLPASPFRTDSADRPSVTVKKLAAPLPIDGDLEKWRKLGLAPQIVITPAAAGSKIKGAKDCSGVIRLAYEGENLYVQLLRFDDVVVFDPKLAPHLQDSLEMLINGFMYGAQFVIGKFGEDGGAVIRRKRFFVKADLDLPAEVAPRVIQVLDSAAAVPERKLIEAATGEDLSQAKVIVMEFKLPIDKRAYAIEGESEPFPVESDKGFWFGFTVNDNDTPGVGGAQKFIGWPAGFGTFLPKDHGVWAVFE